MMRLKNVLLVNAVTSGATGLLLVALNSRIAALFGTNTTWPFTATGIFLILFAIMVFIQSRRSEVSKGWVKFIIALDIIWVVESALILFPRLFNLTSVGYALIAGVALWVALMAILQIRGLAKRAF